MRPGILSSPEPPPTCQQQLLSKPSEHHPIAEEGKRKAGRHGLQTHVIDKTSDLHLQEDAEDVLERAQNFAPQAPWDTVEARNQRVLTFIEQRHYLSLARTHHGAPARTHRFRLVSLGHLRGANPEAARLCQNQRAPARLPEFEITQLHAQQ